MCSLAATAVDQVARRVFLIDDDERTARRLASMLTEDGFEVEVMRDGREAIERLGRDPAPDAIITDLVMPRAGGIAVLGEARRRWRGIPVIFVTGHPDLLKSPTVPFEPSPVVFTKPVSYAELSAKLREVLGKATT